MVAVFPPHSFKPPPPVKPGIASLRQPLTSDWTGRGFCSSIKFVPITSKTTGHANSANKAGGVSFETALKKLETIVDAMESEDLPLETLLARYEEGTQLARLCQEKLAEADLKIQQLEKNAAGELKLKPMASEPSEAD